MAYSASPDLTHTGGQPEVLHNAVTVALSASSAKICQFPSGRLKPGRVSVYYNVGGSGTAKVQIFAVNPGADALLAEVASVTSATGVKVLSIPVADSVYKQIKVTVTETGGANSVTVTTYVAMD